MCLVKDETNWKCFCCKPTLNIFLFDCLHEEGNYLYQPPHQRLQIFALENSLWIHMLRFYDKLPKRKTNINNLLQSGHSKQGYLKENCPITTFSENNRFSRFLANSKGHMEDTLINTVMDYGKQLDMCKISVIHVQDLTDNPLDSVHSPQFFP